MMSDGDRFTWPPSDALEYIYSDQFGIVTEKIQRDMERKFSNHIQIALDWTYECTTEIFLEFVDLSPKKRKEYLTKFATEDSYERFIKRKIEWKILSELRKSENEKRVPFDDFEGVLTSRTTDPDTYADFEEFQAALPDDLKLVLSEYLCVENFENSQRKHISHNQVIAEKLNLTERTIQRRIKALKEIFENLFLN